MQLCYKEMSINIEGFLEEIGLISPLRCQCPSHGGMWITTISCSIVVLTSLLVLRVVDLVGTC